jgi:hypothetical protein
VLGFSRIESGKEEAIEEAYKTVDLIRELVIMGRSGAEKKGFVLNFMLTKTCP